jgi:hypothetical protein
MTGNRQLPNLIIGGVTKAGTNSLFAYLSQHPEICPIQTSETIAYSGTGAAHTGHNLVLRNLKGERYGMLNDPAYFHRGREAIEAINRTPPDLRVIISLRNPSDRIVSAYVMQLRKGHIGPEVSLQEFVERCLKVHLDGTAHQPGQQTYRCLSTGFYADFAGAWLDSMGDRVRFIFFEEWTKQVQPSVSEICSWLEIEPGAVASLDYAVRNKGVLHRSRTLWRVAASVNRRSYVWLLEHPNWRAALKRAYSAVNTVEFQPEVDESSRLLLQDLYMDPNRRLAAELQRHGYDNLPAWLDPDPQLAKAGSNGFAESQANGAAHLNGLTSVSNWRATTHAGSHAVQTFARPDDPGSKITTQADGTAEL